MEDGMKEGQRQNGEMRGKGMRGGGGERRCLLVATKRALTLLPGQSWHSE